MQASLFAIGQALAVLINVLGAALLVLELSGRTIAFRQPYIRPNGFRWSAAAVATAGVGAAVFVVGLASLGNIIVIIPGFVSINPTRGLELVFGLLFGLPGVAAGMIGNPIGDVLTGKLSLGSFAGCITTGLTSYLFYPCVSRQSRSAQFCQSERVGPLSPDHSVYGRGVERDRDSGVPRRCRIAAAACRLAGRLSVNRHCRRTGQCRCRQHPDRKFSILSLTASAHPEAESVHPVRVEPAL